jgi:type II secretory pathway pseudopilin PulG
LRDQKQVGFFEKAGVWLGIWTGPKGVDIQRPPGRKVAAVAAAVLVLLGVIAALVVPPLQRSKQASERRQRAEQAAEVHREEARLRVDQRLHLATGHRPAGADNPALRRAARVQLERAITLDARKRVKSGALDGPVRKTTCDPSTDREETNLRSATGLYKCLAVTGDIAKTPRTFSAIVGYPFVATIDYRRFGFAWCKTNPQPGEKAGHGLARVLLDRRCAGRLRAVL